jgi:hypothetical protein
MAGRIFTRNKNKLSEATSQALGTDGNSDDNGDGTYDLEDEASAGAEGLTGPEAATAAAHHDPDFSDMDEPNLDGVSAAEATAGYVAQGNDNAQAAEAQAPQQAAPTRRAIPRTLLSPYAKQLVLKGLESLQRIPSASLSENYRSQLLWFRELTDQVHKANIRGETKILATIIGILAVDQRGKIDALSFLRHIMRQSVWQASVDTVRLRNAAKRTSGARPYGEDETRPAPMGMEGMSDHSDAIAGVRGSSEQVEYDEDTIIDGLTEVNGYLTTFADTLCDSENDRIYFALENGLQYIDVQGLVPGSWVGVFDPVEAIDIQIVKNHESQGRRDAERTLRRRQALAELAALGG